MRFGDESYKDYVELDPAAFYARLRTAAETPSTSQPTPGDFLAVYEELAGYERILSLHIAGKLSGTDRARAAPPLVGATIASAGCDSRAASVAIAMLLGGAPAPARARDQRRRGRRARRVTVLELLFTVDTLEYLARGGRIGRAWAWAGELLNIKPILTIKDGEVIPVKRVRGSRKVFLEFELAFTLSTRPRAEPCGSGSHTRTLPSGRGRFRKLVSAPGRRRSWSSSRRSARWSARTQGRKLSGSSGSTTSNSLVNFLDGRCPEVAGGGRAPTGAGLGCRGLHDPERQRPVSSRSPASGLRWSRSLRSSGCAGPRPARAPASPPLRAGCSPPADRSLLAGRRRRSRRRCGSVSCAATAAEPARSSTLGSVTRAAKIVAGVVQPSLARKRSCNPGRTRGPPRPPSNCNGFQVRSHDFNGVSATADFAPVYPPARRCRRSGCECS